MIEPSELRKIADANGAPEMDPLRRAADYLELLLVQHLEEGDRWRIRYQTVSDDWKRELRMREQLHEALRALVDGRDGAMIVARKVLDRTH